MLEKDHIITMKKRYSRSVLLGIPSLPLGAVNWPQVHWVQSAVLVLGEIPKKAEVLWFFLGP